MKFIPDGIGRKIGDTSLLASEHAPKILFVGGVVGMVGSTVLACRATLKVEEVLDEIETNKQTASDTKHMVDTGQVSKDVTYTDKEYKKDLYIISVRGAGKIARLYAPAVLLGGASIFALTKSHNLLQDRNLALTAAYAAVDGAYARYRERVIERYGEEVDRELRYDTETIDVVDEETGKVTSEEIITGAPGSGYARWYDEISSANWSPDRDVNMLFLRNVQNYMNDRLHIKGHVFLNEVYDALGLTHTNKGAMVGWRYDKNSGDDYIDFGILEGRSQEFKPGMNGREGAILLDFNVDGTIYGKLEETGI
jgi:hypothetical protein